MSDENPVKIFSISTADAGRRLDAFLVDNVGDWSRSRLRQLIDAGHVLVSGRRAKPSQRLREADEVEIAFVEQPSAVFEPQKMSLDIVFEDESVAVINKSAGLVVHPGAGVGTGTLANALAYHFKLDAADLQVESSDGEHSKIDRLKSKIGIVHRLDKDTSGLIVVAKTPAASENLSAQFENRTVEKRYVALVHGATAERTGKIDRPIARDRWHRTKMAIAAAGRKAVSTWKVSERFEKFTLLDVTIETGRTHQIRVHLASINHPIVGDSTYNEGRDNTIGDAEIKNAVVRLKRFFLHAGHLAFTHPITAERLSFAAPLPAELNGLLSILKR